jgi:UDP-N-acetylglucosamine 2-epimerase
MYDALLYFLPLASRTSRILDSLGLTSREYALLTLHRAENVDDPAQLALIMTKVGALDDRVIFPVHPRTEKRLKENGLWNSMSANITPVPPLGYLDMLRLQSKSMVVLTDSGGVQREAYFLSVPSVILRAETEWVELVREGASRLVGLGFEELSSARLRMASRVSPSAEFGNGQAHVLIAKHLEVSTNCRHELEAACS